MNIDWISDLNEEDRPRKLTRGEIDHITSHIAVAPTTAIYSAQCHKNHSIRYLNNLLKDVYISPSLIPIMTHNIIKNYHDNLMVFH